MIRLLGGVLLSYAISIASAAAFCSAPSFYAFSPPDPPGSYERPDVPYCLQEYAWSQEHTCDQWELDSYRSDVEEYIRKLADFSSEANDFANEATNFASEAYDYAKCEADEVSSQHE